MTYRIDPWAPHYTSTERQLHRLIKSSMLSSWSVRMKFNHDQVLRLFLWQEEQLRSGIRSMNVFEVGREIKVVPFNLIRHERDIYGKWKSGDGTMLRNKVAKPSAATVGRCLPLFQRSLLEDLAMLGDV